jgi:hypothetical protein
MIRDTIVSVLVSRLNNRTDLTDKIVLEMQLAQDRIEMNGEFFPWFLVSEYATEVTEIGEPRVPLPTDFLGEIEEEALWLQPQSDPGQAWKRLVKGDSEELELAYGITPGEPEKYALMGEEFILYPIPDSAYTLRMKYYARAAALSANIENAWLKYAADLIIAEVGEVMASLTIQNPALAAEFEKDKVTAWARLRLADEARKHVNRDYTMGGD